MTTMMRGMDSHQYVPAPYTPDIRQGSVRVQNVNGIVTTWAVSRPVAFPTPKYNPPASIPRGSGVGFSPARPNVEMDPSNQQTWQRQYRFTR
jgi:hypothetical protein